MMGKFSIHNLFYIPPEKIIDDKIAIEGKELHHIKNVLRKKVGDTIFLTDGEGHRYKVSITQISRSLINAEILDKVHIKRAMIVALTLAFVPLKGLRNDFILEKGTELGVRRFLPFKSIFSAIPTLNSTTKLIHFRNVAISAMLQSQQYYIPEIIYQNEFDNLLKYFSNFDCVVLADRNGKQQIPSGAGSILYIVGPEGGFDDSEIERFTEKDAQLLSLGRTRLRSETAAIAGIIKILAALGDI